MCCVVVIVRRFLSLISRPALCANKFLSCACLPAWSVSLPHLKITTVGRKVADFPMTRIAIAASLCLMVKLTFCVRLASPLVSAKVRPSNDVARGSVFADVFTFVAFGPGDHKLTMGFESWTSKPSFLNRKKTFSTFRFC
jgi:hypothetical protein